MHEMNFLCTESSVSVSKCSNLLILSLFPLKKIFDYIVFLKFDFVTDISSIHEDRDKSRIFVKGGGAIIYYKIR